MANNEFIGRRVSVGLGVESAYGTAIAPTIWPRQLKMNFQRKTTRVENDSAMGRIEKTNDSAVVEEWAEGTLEGKVYDTSIGYLLYNIFGTCVNSTNADASGTVYNHTIDVAQTNVAKSLTIARIDPISSRRHAMGTVMNLDITADQGDWVKFSSAIQAQVGTTSSDTAAYVVENPFTSKHVTVKLATNVAGLGAATALAIKHLKLSIKEAVTPYYAHGAIDPAAFNTGAWQATGEVTLRYTDGTLESNWFTNAIQAMSIAFKNTDVTIGTSANPSLTFTAPRVRLNTFVMSDPLDSVVEQTVGFTCELDTSAAYALRAVLVNTAPTIP